MGACIDIPAGPWMAEPGMKFPSDVPINVIHEILSEIQKALWLDRSTNSDFWNADKQWNPETLEEISQPSR